jgi:predicted dehydrogenase
LPAKLRYACIGAGRIACKKHLGIYAGSEDVELAAVCDTSPQAARSAADRFGAPHAYTRLDEMLDCEPLDFVSICTPNVTHAPIALAVMERGIHIHCEKPVAVHAGEVLALRRKACEKGILFMAGLNYRFSEETARIRQCIADGLLGDIYHVRCGWMRRNGIPGRGGWFTDRALSGGGVLIDLGVHYLDLMMHFLDYPVCEWVSARTGAYFARDPSRVREDYPDRGEGVFDVEDTATGLLSFRRGPSLHFEFSWAANIEAETRSYRLLGTRGSLYVRNGMIRYIGEADGRPVDWTEDVGTIIPPGVEQACFLRCLRTGTQPEASLDRALPLMAVIDAAYASAAANGKSVSPQIAV